MGSHADIIMSCAGGCCGLPEGLKVGNRFRFKEHTGWIRYIGQLGEARPGDWIGVEWDVKPGKNNGEMDGVQYFECKVPGQGSFFQTSMAPKLTLPCTYKQAVQQQYADKAKGDSKDYMMGAMQEAEKSLVVEELEAIDVGRDPDEEQCTAQFQGSFGLSGPQGEAAEATPKVK